MGERVKPTVKTAHAEWVWIDKPCWVIRYTESGEWCIASSQGFERHVEANVRTLDSIPPRTTWQAFKHRLSQIINYPDSLHGGRGTGETEG